MMELTIVHIHRFEFPGGHVTPRDLKDLESRIMSKLSDKIAEVRAAVDEAVGRVQADVADLQSQIDALQAKVDEGTATEADIAALESIKADLAALDPTRPEVLPEG